MRFTIGNQRYTISPKILSLALGWLQNPTLCLDYQAGINIPLHIPLPDIEDIINLLADRYMDHNMFKEMLSELGIDLGPVQFSLLEMAKNSKMSRMVSNHKIFSQQSAQMDHAQFTSTLDNQDSFFIEANVKKWGLAPMTGSLAPPPPYGSEQGSILLEAGRDGAQSSNGHYQPDPRHGRTRSGNFRPGPPTSPGPIRSPHRYFF
ncbi:hypothetical protein EYC84_007806 [Monilinia fructicola]|uniref:Uncharacterized protein n=1 Tax=Monilinia fructicola TaxID=38448 RepID=A0A5M9JKB1_MONFR|nr:hypothetical protein EYC84_007806 [Monilinia fructicola]